MRLFGKAKKAPSTEEGIQKIRDNIGTLDKREQFLQKKIDRELEEAKRLSRAKNKKGALQHLKLKAMYTNQQDKISNTKMQLLQQVAVLEDATANMETFHAMQTGADAMKQVHGALTVDKVNDTMDDVREQMAVANEISDVMAEPFQAIPGVDDDDLLAELEEMEQEDMDSQLAGLDETALPDFPEVAATQPAAAAPAAAKPRAKTKEEEELEALAASMAL